MGYDRDEGQEIEHTLILSQRDLRAARRLLSMLARTDDATRTRDELSVSLRPLEDPRRDALVARAREEFTNRGRRVGIFSSSMFGEPAWDMLLALYVLDVAGQRQTIGTLLQFSNTSMSTAKRWLDYLAVQGLVIREEHPTDRRTAFVKLSPKARDKLDLYYSETSRKDV